MRALTKLAVAAAVVLAGVNLSHDSHDDPPPTSVDDVTVTHDAAEPDAAADVTAPVGAEATTAPPVPEERASTEPLLMPADHGDGDSWRDTAGVEYRLGLVNAPEQDECFGAEATAERRALTAGGFRANVYDTDRYGRGVSVVTTADGVNLNVHLARHGFVDDRYLQQFRHENPGLAALLDAAFVAARAEGAGLWSRCSAGARSAAAPAAPASADIGAATDGCHPDYTPCLPIVGDGSGNGRANDVDCGQLNGPAPTKQAGVDPYRLDGDGDGVGCDS